MGCDKAFKKNNGFHKLLIRPHFSGVVRGSGGLVDQSFFRIFSGEREFFSQYKFYAAFESFGPQTKPTGQRDFPGRDVTGFSGLFS